MTQFLQLSGVLLAVSILVVFFVLDMAGNLDTVQHKFPKLWLAMNSRAVIVALLIACLVFLQRDFKDALISYAPFVARIPPPPPPIVNPGPQINVQGSIVNIPPGQGNSVDETSLLGLSDAVLIDVAKSYAERIRTTYETWDHTKIRDEEHRAMGNMTSADWEKENFEIIKRRANYETDMQHLVFDANPVRGAILKRSRVFYTETDSEKQEDQVQLEAFEKAAKGNVDGFDARKASSYLNTLTKRFAP